MAGITQNSLAIDPHLLETLKSIELRSRFLVKGMYHNRHRTSQFGSSVEFIDHRDYRRGDEIRTIDWRLFARTDRLFVKRYEMEANMQVHLLLDTSESMRVLPPPGLPGKLDLAAVIAGAIASMVISRQDAAGLCCLSDRIDERIPARQGEAHLAQLYHHLADPPGSGGGHFGELVTHVLPRLGKRGIAVVLSDGMDDLDSLFDALKGLCVRENDVLFFQMLDRDELEFPYDRMTEFRNPETGDKVVCDPTSLRDRYLERLQAHLDAIEDFAKKWRIDYVRIVNTDDLLKLLTSHFLRRLMMTKGS
jgi:uncharacterized protein (DUF58 family)